MAEKERITQPSMGSNKLGTETREDSSSGMPSGTDTQTRMAALSKGKKKSGKEDINDDEMVIKQKEGKSKIIEDDENSNP